MASWVIITIVSAVSVVTAVLGSCIYRRSYMGHVLDVLGPHSESQRDSNASLLERE
jgi:hypothetical protein